MLRTCALTAIAGYQRYLSPRKRWRCAYGVHTGRASCSDFGRRAVEDHGVVGGVRLLLRRFQACRGAALALATAAADDEEAGTKTESAGTSCGGVNDAGNVACCAMDVGAHACR